MSTTVYVRHGQLIDFVRENPKPRQATELLEAFAGSRTRWEDGYRQAIASAAKAQDCEVAFADSAARLGREENAYVVDYPRLRIRRERSVWQTRLCVNICTGKSSSKVWSEVSISTDIPGVSPRVGMNEVEPLCRGFRAIADKSVEHGFARLQELMNVHLPNSTFHKKAVVRATSLGIMDAYLAAPFERLYQESIPVTELLEADETLDRKLTDYCRKISSIVETGELSGYATSEQGRAVLWFKMPMPAMLPSREVVQRVVLYLMRETSGHVEIIGLAYDDSEKADIVLRSGAALSRTIGPWI